MHYKEKQLTFGNKGHFLNTAQCFSPDGQWIVYDTRNDDTKIGSTASIEMVNVDTGEIKELYHTQNQTEHGPGVGAATFSPVKNRVIFIHGIGNANQRRPYSFSRRTGVAIDVDKPNIPYFMDARCVTEPFIPGALRGGTHAHIWSADGQWLSFTYNDYVIEQLSNINPAVKDLRTVGVMFPRPIFVPEDKNGENHSGEMYAVAIADVTENPRPGSDDIDKAFDEAWIGKNGYLKTDGSRQKRAIAFQGNVRDEQGHTKTEVFIADLPDDLTLAQTWQPIEGTATSRPSVPFGVTQRRVTFTNTGIAGPRHWLKTTPDDDLICFLSKDDFGFINIFGVHPSGGPIKQLTSNKFDVQSGFNISPDGKLLAYIADDSIIVSDIFSGESNKISPQEKPVGKVVWSPDGKMLAFNSYIKKGDQSYFQIMSLCQN
jgi:Tol biopolymer transport system component